MTKENKHKSYVACSGWNRGGTSALMSVIKEAGIPIVGFKYPYQFKFDYIKGDQILKQGVKKDGGLLIADEAVRKRNPSGYWEIASICIGGGLQKEHEDIGEDGNVIKIPLDTLPSSDPEMIDKIVVILRNPLKVLGSMISIHGPEKQEEMIRVGSLGLIYNLMVSLEWIEKNKIKHIIVHYEDMIRKPIEFVEDICNFIGRGEHLWGAKIVERKLNRSKAIEKRYIEVERLEAFYLEYGWEKKMDLIELKKEIDKLRKEYENKN